MPTRFPGTSRANGADEPTEPFPWMSREKQTGRFRLPLRHPASEAITGILLLIVAVVFFIALVSARSVGALVVGILLLSVFGTLGVTLLVMAAARWRWFVAYRQH